ncbi:MAG: LicD family protein [Lachnospiraceae bacterium]|nr:LicD family protein [Lachnospiraceae bacterium]
MNELQAKVYEIWQEIDKVCRNNKIEYFAIGGTCLGAVRHKGFIPWDDDIDIAIPIENYERFIKIAQKEMPSYLTVRFPNDFYKYTSMFIKIVDKRTTLIENGKGVEEYDGVFVDVMPLSGIPSKKIQRYFFAKKLLLYQKLNYKRRRGFYENDSLLGKGIWCITYLFLRNHSFDYYYKKYYKEIKKYKFYESEYTGYSWSPVRIYKEIYRREVFSPAQYLDFENDQIPCPHDPHSFLTGMFGEYMVVPEIKEREWHTSFYDLSRPASYYRNNQEKVQNRMQEDKK